MPAFYSDILENFLNKEEDALLGILSQNYAERGYTDLKTKQIDSWRSLIVILRVVLEKIDLTLYEKKQAAILIEYEIPRRAKRIDCILIFGNKLIILEFKNGENQFLAAYKKQLYNYCWDLVEFHSESKGLFINPILLCSSAETKTNSLSENALIDKIICCGSNSLPLALSEILESNSNNNTIDYKSWSLSNYKPTPSIVEAATSLFSNQGVEEILQNQAGKVNLTKTSNRILQIIEDARLGNKKVICFITGVPGAGKTLAGLKIVHERGLYKSDKGLGIFISGNGPLISVLKEALAMDHNKRNSCNISESRQFVSTFIQNVRDFISPKEDRLDKEFDKIIVFDEAQRAWSREKKEKKSGGKYKASEPELLLSIMNEHDWAVFIALVGSGQEIHDGEAGLPEWGAALVRKFTDWEIYISPALSDRESTVEGLKLFDEFPKQMVVHNDENDLHLSVNIRTPRAGSLSDWVSHALNNDSNTAKIIYELSLQRFPFYITRDLEKAKNWLQGIAGVDSRYGVIGSSGGRRIRAYGLDVKSRVEVEKWFLKDKKDIRSSFCLETIATEFDIQGLELDWVLLCWDADLRRALNEWSFKNFSGTEWKNVNIKLTRNYIINRYRVLLTRAREGMVVFVPGGNENDETRLPEFYDPIYEYLKSCGLEVLI